MKIKKTNLVLVFSLLFFSPSIFAIKISQIKLRSLLNEPFQAKIMVSEAEAISEEGLRVSLAERALYAELGQEPFSWLYKMDVRVKKDPKTHKFLIELSTLEPVKDPYIDLILVFNWEQGSIVREYTVLLDPPKVAVPDSLTKVTEKQKVQKSTATASVPAPSRIAKLINKRSSMRRLERARSRVVRPGGRYGPSKEETLWNVAKQLVKDTPYSVSQAVVAITNKNPDAFEDGNINNFSNTVALDLPSQRDLASYSEEDAQYFIDAQNEDWERSYVKASIASVDTQGLSVKPLRLVAPGQEEASQEEALDTLKRTNEMILQTNEVLKNQNTVLNEKLLQQEKEIEQLKIMVQQSINDASFPQSGSQSLPRSSTIKIAMLMIVVSIMVVFFMSLTIWLLRDSIFRLVYKWKEKVGSFMGMHRSAPASLKTGSGVMRDYVLFDLEKALNVLYQEEKRFSSGRKTKEEGENSLEAVDAYIAYEQYAQAEKALEIILSTQPENWEAVLKLLGVYVLTEDYDNFEKAYRSLPANLATDSPALYSKMEVLNKKVQNEKSLKFAQTKPPA